MNPTLLARLKSVFFVLKSLSKTIRGSKAVLEMAVLMIRMVDLIFGLHATPQILHIDEVDKRYRLFLHVVGKLYRRHNQTLSAR